MLPFSYQIYLQSVHILYCTSREDNIVDGFLELPHGKVHRTYGEQWERMHLNHDGGETYVQDHTEKTCAKKGSKLCD